MITYYVNDVPLSNEEDGIRLLAVSNIPVISGVETTSVSIPGMDGVIAVPIGASPALVKVVCRILRSQEESFANFFSRYRSFQTLLRAAKVFGLFDGQSFVENDVVSIDMHVPDLQSDNRIVVGATFTVQPFWREKGDPVVTANVLANGTVTLSEFNRCTGKLVDAVIRLRGPFTRVVLSAENGTGLTVDGAFTNSDYVFVDLKDLKAWKSNQHDAWDGAGAPVMWDYPAGGLLALEPGFSTGKRRYSVDIKVTGANNQSVFSVRSSRWHI